MDFSKDPNFSMFEDSNKNLTALQKLTADWKNLSDAHEVVLTNLHGDVVDNFDSRLTKVHIRIMDTDLLVFKLPITLDNLASLRRHIEAVRVEPLFANLLPRMAKLGWRIVPNPEIPNAEIRRLSMDPRPVVVSTNDARELSYPQSYEGYYALSVDLERAQTRYLLIEAMSYLKEHGIKIRFCSDSIKWTDKERVSYSADYTLDTAELILGQPLYVRLYRQM